VGQGVGKRVVGIVGSYRKGMVIDGAVTAILDGARQEGAETEKIYLIDKHIEFCDNCRGCTQEVEPELVRGSCVHKDDMGKILSKIDEADAVVLGSPVNFSTVTAVMKRFVERLVVYVYWPWGAKAPRLRIKNPNKRAIIITSSAAPAFVGRVLMPNALSVMKRAAKCIGARVVKRFYLGMVAGKKDEGLGAKGLDRMRQAGKKLVDF